MDKFINLKKALRHKVGCLLNRYTPLTVSLICLLFLALVVSQLKKLGYHLTYVVTPSVPRGLYLVVPTKNIQSNDMLEFMPPIMTNEFAMSQQWFQPNRPLVKYVFAQAGDHVCIKNQAIFINGKKIAPVYSSYDDHKLLPKFTICDRINHGEYLLLSTKSTRSFDSRYFGLISLRQIRGRAIPLYVESISGSTGN